MYAEFDLIRPGSMEELLAALAKQPEGSEILAGGTVALADIRSSKSAPGRVISLDRIADLKGIRTSGGAISLGARTTVTDLLASPDIARLAPSLVEASRAFAGQMVRNTATIAGNIACGSPAADLVPPLLSLDAEIELVSPAGTRRIALADYYLGYKKDVRQPDEVITRVILPAPQGAVFNAFYKLARRKGDAITVTGVAVTVSLTNGVCGKARIALGSVSPAPARARQAEQMLEGKCLTPEIIALAASAAAQACSPIDDVRASAGYRRKMVGVLTRRLLTQALEKLS